MLVDLFTGDKELAIIILNEFPGKINPETQYKVDDSEPGIKVHCFYSLEYNAISEFLKLQEGAYELRGIDGKPIEKRQRKCRISPENFINPN